jgi:hypothetical protein
MWLTELLRLKISWNEDTIQITDKVMKTIDEKS